MKTKQCFIETPFGRLPVLMIDDKPLPQSGAIIRFLAAELNLEPEDNLGKAYADMIMGAMEDASKNFPYFEKDESKKIRIAYTVLFLRNLIFNATNVY